MDVMDPIDRLQSLTKGGFPPKKKGGDSDDGEYDRGYDDRDSDKPRDADNDGKPDEEKDEQGSDDSEEEGGSEGADEEEGSEEGDDSEGDEEEGEEGDGDEDPGSLFDDGDGDEPEEGEAAGPDGSLQELVQKIASAEKDFYAARGMHGGGHHSEHTAMEVFHKLVRKLVKKVGMANGMDEGGENDGELPPPDDGKGKPFKGKPGADEKAGGDPDAKPPAFGKDDDSDEEDDDDEPTMKSFASMDLGVLLDESKPFNQMIEMQKAGWWPVVPKAERMAKAKAAACQATPGFPDDWEDANGNDGSFLDWGKIIGPHAKEGGGSVPTVQPTPTDTAAGFINDDDPMNSGDFIDWENVLKSEAEAPTMRKSDSMIAGYKAQAAEADYVVAPTGLPVRRQAPIAQPEPMMKSVSYAEVVDTQVDAIDALVKGAKPAAPVPPQPEAPAGLVGEIAALRKGYAATLVPVAPEAHQPARHEAAAPAWQPDFDMYGRPLPKAVRKAEESTYVPPTGMQWMGDNPDANVGIRREVAPMQKAAFIDDTANPMRVLRETQRDLHKAQWGIVDPIAKANMSATCPIHSVDISKASMLTHKYLSCTCGK